MDFTLSEELSMVREMARDFVTNELLPVERDVLVREKGGSHGAPVPADKRERLKKLAVEQGLWAMTAPEALGGGGLSTLGACLVAEELGKTFVDFDFGDVPPILFEANTEQQARYLAPVISGEKDCVLALGEPEWNGTADIKARAARDGEGWRLNGVKLAEDADLFLVFAQADEGTTCYIVERGGQGVNNQDGKLVLENAPLPAANVLGPVGGATALGKKYQQAGQARAAARKIGIACRLLEMSWQYARDWKALGQALAVRPAIQRHLAEMATEIDAARWMVYHAASEIDEGKDARQATLRAGLFASDMARRTIDRTVEIYGGPAHAAELPVLRVYRSSLSPQTSERILELQRWRIANDLINP
ncbi:MAG: acyl-CoA dehydrogenase family protein, partial [Acidobacteriota bacterium]